MKWRVCPKWYYIDGKGPCILTCRDHDKGTKQKYIHLPRNPFEHNLPSRVGDQLCHVVLKPRVIKPMRAGSYSNTYQMHEQKGCIHGIDTCSLTSFVNFSEQDNWLWAPLFIGRDRTPYSLLSLYIGEM